MAEEKILDYKKLEIRHKTEPDEEILSLIAKTVLGTGAGLRYSVRDAAERMKYYGNGLSFVALYKRNNLEGVIGLSRRTITNGERNYRSTFLRYLAVRGAFQIPKVANRSLQRLSRMQDSFKQKIFSLFSSPASIPGAMENPSDPHVVYACVERENDRSRNFVRQAGYEHIRSFATIAFSRFHPKRNPAVHRLSPAEEPEMMRLLDEQYREYTFYTSEFSFLDHRYYVMKEGERILAGVSAIPTVFRVVHFPGLRGWVLMNLLPVLPYFRQIFRPGEFGFLVLDSIYCPQGSEHLLPDLFESVCATEGLSSGLTWHDTESRLCRALQANRRLGVLNRILTTKPGVLYASFSNISAEEKRNFIEKPAFLAGLDFA
ncbi:MAG: hypothetical protein GYA43_08355 [Bacteroidales bacterium]|nr:hypothetical protein [Bacteroidales bacterium]